MKIVEVGESQVRLDERVPSKHTTSFRCPYNVHNVKTTSYGCQNNIVCVLGKLKWSNVWVRMGETG